MATRRRKTSSRRRTVRRKRRNPYRVKAAAPRRNAYLWRNPPRRRRRARRNPLVPTGLFRRGIAVAAGFILAPKITDMIPFQLPGGKIGQYAKEFIVISIGSQLVTKAMGRRYGNALFAGGLVHIGVDVLQSFVPAFSGGGVGYYFPPNEELGAMYGGMGVANGGALPPPDVFQSGQVNRLSSRFN